MLENKMNSKNQSKETDNSSGIAKILRVIGAGLILSGAIAYLLEGWYSVSDIARYLKFLTVTGLLSILGVIVAVYLKENRGARTFIALAVAAVPVNFCQLGAFIYSVVSYKAVPENLTNYLIWQAPSLSVAIAVTLLGTLVLTGVCWLSLSILGRQGRSLLLPVIIGLNALLLIPVRGIASVSVLAVISAYLAFKTTSKLSKINTFEYTMEGLICKLLLWIPSSILLLRTAFIYDSSQVLVGILTIYLGAIILAISKIFNTENQKSGFSEFVGGSLILAGTIIEEHLLFEIIGFNTQELMIPLLAFATVITTEIMMEVLKIKSNSIRELAYTFACLISCIYTMSVSNVFQMSLSIAIGVIGVFVAKSERSRYLYEISRFTGFLGMGYLAYFGLPNLIDSWLSISLLGIVLLVLSSIIEVRGLAMKFIAYDDGEVKA